MHYIENRVQKGRRRYD